MVHLRDDGRVPITREHLSPAHDAFCDYSKRNAINAVTHGRRQYYNPNRSEKPKLHVFIYADIARMVGLENVE